MLLGQEGDLTQFGGCQKNISKEVTLDLRDKVSQ